MSGRACRWSDVMSRAGAARGAPVQGNFRALGILKRVAVDVAMLLGFLARRGDVGSYRETPKNAAARGFCLLGVLRRVCYS